MLFRSSVRLHSKASDLLWFSLEIIDQIGHATIHVVRLIALEHFADVLDVSHLGVSEDSDD